MRGDEQDEEKVAGAGDDGDEGVAGADYGD